MTRVGLLSDTHGYLDKRLFDHFSLCDEIWHSGDFGTPSLSDALAAFKPLRGVYGNIDGHELRQIHPLHNRFKCEGLNVWITHIGGYPGHYAPGIKAEMAMSNVDLFISGHSHILKVMRDPTNRNLLHMNPGAAGLEGFHRMRTAIRFKVEGRKIFDVEVIELGLRGSIENLQR